MKIVLKKIDMIKVITIIAMVFVLLLVIVIGFVAVNKHWRMTRCLNSQPNTTWISEDKTIVFSVDPNTKITGTINLDEKCYDFYLVDFMGADIIIYPTSAIEKEGPIDDNEKYEYWSCSYKSKKKFVATVKKTTFFEEGQKITFYRVDE